MDFATACTSDGCGLLAGRYAAAPEPHYPGDAADIFNLVEENKRVYSELTEARREIVGLSAQVAQLTLENAELKQMIENL